MANPYFNAVYYLQQNPDVFSAGYTVATAWDHYVKHGANEANVTGGTFRAPNPWFDVKYYLANNPDLVRAGITPATALDHFLTYGSTAGEDRAPNATIAAAPITEAKLLAYALANADLQTAFGISASATTLTAAQQTSLLNHFYAYGYNESRADAPASVTIPDVDAGKTFTLTTAVDNFIGTSGDDTFIGGTAQIQAADVINGAAGNDVAKLYLDTGAAGLNSSNVEQFFIQASGAGRTFTATNVDGAKEFWSNESTTALTVANIQNNAALGLLETQANLNASFKAGVIGSAETLTLATNASGVLGTPVTVAVDDGGTASKFTTLAVNAVAGKSYITIDDVVAAANSTTDFTAISTSGNGYVSLTSQSTNAAVEPFANVTSVTMQAAGGSRVDLAAAVNAKDVTVTGSAADETIVFAATRFNTLDKVDLGTGFNTLVLGDANLAQAATADLTKAINASKGVSVLATTANGAGADVAINAARYSEIKAFAVGLGGAITGTVAVGAKAAAPANAAANAAAAVTVSGVAASGNSVEVQNNLTGGASTAGAAANDDAGQAAAGLVVRMGTDGASDTFSISVAQNASTITGGAGVASAGGTGTAGTAAVGIDAREIETFNINATKALTVVAGATNGGTAATLDVLVGANATLNITGSADVNLGRVGTNAGAAFENFTINAGELAGKLTVVTGAGNDTITAGSKGSDITAGAGADKITLGAGTDTVRVAAGDSGATVTATSISGIDTITGFKGGLGGDVIDFTGATSYKALTGAQKTAVANANDLVEAVNVIMNAFAANEATAFEFGGKTYVVADLDGNAVYNGAGDAIVELVGVSAADIGTANIA